MLNYNQHNLLILCYLYVVIMFMSCYNKDKKTEREMINMALQKFIRIDMKGHWRGTEHRSSLSGVEEHGIWEAGISCYQIGNNIAEALENLRRYWTEIASCNIDDFKDFQITIFEGELLPEKGSDWEDLATCERTSYELEAYPIMKAVIEAHERICTFGEPDEDEITEEEYEDFLRGLIAC